ncbi:MAG: EAL domain-containing protein [Nevskia sp.]|nr:EAL domain-containing protein [Nevskia sp.]
MESREPDAEDRIVPSDWQAAGESRATEPEGDRVGVQAPPAESRRLGGDNRLLQAIEAFGAGTWVWGIANQTLEWSETLKSIFGLAPGANPTLEDFVNAIHVDDRPMVFARFRAAVVQNIEYEAEYRIIRQDGAMRWVDSRGRCEYDAAGPLRMVGATRDIHESKLAQLALKRSEERFRSLVEASTQIVWLADPRGSVFNVSPVFERYTGLPPERAYAQDWLTVVHPDDRARVVEDWAEGIRRGGNYENRFRMLMRDGSYRYFRSSAVPLRNAEGKVIEWVGTATDIHDQQVAEDALRQANEALQLKVIQREQAEAAARRLNRVYAVLSGINTLIVRARNQQELFDGACRIAVEQGLFPMAWIGRLQGDALVPVASCGLSEGYIDSRQRIRLSGEQPAGRGPSAGNLREGRPRICNDIATDPDFASWRDEALSRGFRSVAAFPLQAGNKMIGCICFYAGESDFFDDSEVKLLAELAGDISYALEFISREEQLDYLAYYDVLTRLANRRLFSDRLNQYAQAARQKEEGLTVLLLDVARFKTVNDTLGMAAGDELLKMFARRLRRYAGGANRLARVSGDRFAVIAPDLRHTPGLATVMRERMWNGLNRPYLLAGQEVRVSARVGIAIFPEDGDDGDSLIQNAEAALKKAKTSGENYLFYTQQMGLALKQKLKLEGQLRRALDESEFVLYYQPKVDLREGTICGAEALLRWNSPELGLVPPAQIMPLLEETGLILDVGRWVLRQAAADRNRWLAAGLALPHIAVNVSPLQLRQPDFVDEVRAVVQGRGREAAGLELEITESVLMPDMQQHIGKLRDVREMGVQLAIDDFGTGYSSLSYLSKLPVSSVKIDRSFIIGMTDSADTMGIVSTIISLARSMSLRVVAEGVDSDEQLKFLRLLRCDEIQGFLFSPAVPADDFARMLRDGRRL